MFSSPTLIAIPSSKQTILQAVKAYYCLTFKSSKYQTKKMSPLRALQSGGFADVLLNEETGVCYKIFHKKGSEEKEFKIVRHLLSKYESSDTYDVPSRVMKYLDYGYIPKDVALEMYQVTYPNDFKKHNDFVKNFENESFVPYIAMEYIEGIDGLEYGLKYGFLDEVTAAKLMLSLLLSVHEFHEMGFIHRDIKPDNFMVFKNEYGQQDVKLIDLGLAIPISEQVYDGKVAGTKTYLAPEVLSSGWHTTSSDLFSVGLSFYKLCGSPNDFSSRFMKLLLKVTEYDPRRRGTLPETILHLKDIVRGC